MKTLASRKCMVFLTQDDDFYCLEITPLNCQNRTFVYPIKDSENIVTLIKNFLLHARD